MDDPFDLISEVACKAASDIPLDTARTAAQLIRGCATLQEARSKLWQVPNAHYRTTLAWLIETAHNASPQTTPDALSLALLTAAYSDRLHRDDQSVELVWTGPDTSAIPTRRTEQVILQVLDSAQHRITLVSYAVYRIPHVCEALVRAARRGVRITVVVETPDRNEGENEYSTLRALGADVAACCGVYYWPVSKRPVHSNGKTAILHVKCVVADGRWLFLSSANLTEYAFTINAELGVLISGGPLPARVEAQFDHMITFGIWEPI